MNRNEKVLQVLRKHKNAIGWILPKIPGISSSMCMHQILLEDGEKLVRQTQRKLNFLILDFVKNEIAELLKS